MRSKTVYLFLSFYVILVYGKKSCPDIEKCDCSESNKKLNQVDCEDINNMAELKDLAQDLKFELIPVLKIHQCNAKSISRNSFFNFSIKSFSASCPFSNIDDVSLKQIDSLRELKLLTTEFTEIPTAVGRLVDLRVLYVNDGKLTHVKMEFQNMTRLRDLSLKNNKISLIAEKAFYGNSNLKTIDLSENNLMSLSPATFEESRKLKKVFLQEINIRDNRLKSINDAFKFELELEILDLGKNPLKQIGPKAFNSNVRQLKTLILDQCELFSLPSMVFQYLTKLEKLDLSNNKLETISPEIFQDLRNLREINLSDNEIRILGDSYSAKTLGNRWKCDCRFLWLLDSSPNLQHHFTCSSPPRFNKKVLSQLNSLDLTSWTDTCEDSPCKCTCIPREEKFFVRVDCSNRNLTEVPPKLPPEVGELYLQNNLLTNPINLNIHSLTYLRYLDVERNNISNVDFYLPKNLKTFKLSSNNLTRFLSYFPPNISTWSLSNNPWICDCDAIQFLKFLKSESNKVVDINATRCGKIGKKIELHGKLITELTEYELCPERLRLYIFLGVSLA
ncbi:carboxypeptidase N subunit 2, partial [Trichonephila inaurata madagascariensis]